MSIIGVRKIRIKHGRPDMWYQKLAGYVFDIEPYKHGYGLAPTTITKRSLKLAKNIAGVNVSSIGYSRIYLYDVEFIDEPYSQDYYPDLMVGDTIQLNKSRRIPIAWHYHTAVIAGFKIGTGRPYVFTPNLKPNRRYKESTIGIERELHLEDMVLETEDGDA